MNKRVMEKGLINTIWLSEKRRKLMQLLKDGPKDIDEIKSAFNVSSRLIVPQIKQLEKQKIIIENNGIFQLSNIGELLINKMLKIIDINILLDKDKDYWENRMLNSLPPHMYERIGDLENNYLYEYNINNVLEIPPPFYPHLVKTRHYYMLLPYFHPNVIRETLNITKNGTKTILIATPKVVKRIKKEFREDLTKLIYSPNLEIRILDEKTKPPALFITDDLILIGFATEEGVWDDRELISQDEKALNWTQELFIYYKDMSTLLTEI